MKEYTCYPLMRAQKSLADVLGIAPKRPILNLSVRVRFYEPVDENRLAESVRLLPTILPYCSVRFTRKGGELMQYLSEEKPNGLEVFDAQKLSDEKLDARYREWARELFPNQCLDVQLYRVRFVRRGDCGELFFCGHHYIMDAYAVIGAIECLAKIYKALEDGTPLPAKAPLPWEMVEQDAQYYASPRYASDIAWWTELYRTEPHFTSLNGLGSPEFLDGHNYGKGQGITQLKSSWINRLIPATLVQKVNDAAASRRIAVQLYYLLALRSFLGYVSGTDDVIVDTLIARRATLVQKRGGLTRANAIPFRSIIPQSCSFDEALGILDGLQKEMYRHADVMIDGFREIINARHNTPRGCTYHTAWFTYQPYFDLSKTNLRFRANSVSSGEAVAPLYLYITPQDMSGDLIAGYSIAENYIRPEVVDRFHAFLLRFLENGINEPSLEICKLIEKCLA